MDWACSSLPKYPTSYCFVEAAFSSCSPGQLLSFAVVCHLSTQWWIWQQRHHFPSTPVQVIHCCRGLWASGGLQSLWLPSSLFLFFQKVYYCCVCACVHACVRASTEVYVSHGACVEVKGQLLGVGFSLLPWDMGWNLGHQVGVKCTDPWDDLPIRLVWCTLTHGAISPSGWCEVHWPTEPSPHQVGVTHTHPIRLVWSTLTHGAISPVTLLCFFTSVSLVAPFTLAHS